MRSGSQASITVYRLVAASVLILIVDLGLLGTQLGKRVDSILLLAGGLVLPSVVLLVSIAAFLQAKYLKPAFEEMSESLSRLQKLTESLQGTRSPAAQTTFNNLLDQLSENLVETRKREQAIFEKAVDVICVIGVDGRFLSISPSVSRAWGYAPEDLIGKALSDYAVSDNSAKTLETALGSPYSIDRISFDNCLRKKNGDLIDLSWSAHWSAQGDGLFCVAHDISERKQAELKLQESEQRLRTTLEAMPVGVATVHHSGNIEFANASLRHFTGKTDEELLGLPVSELVSEKDRTKIDTYLQQRRAEPADNIPAIELSLLKKERSQARADGEAINADAPLTLVESLPVEVSATLFAVQSTPKLLITFADITHRKQVEQLRREFVSMVNHDLRAPLNSLYGLVDLIQSGAHGALTDKGEQLCKLANLELERLLRLVNGLLDLDKMESGKLAVQVQLVSALDIIEASVSAVRTYADLRGIQLVYPETEAACWADRARIIQVLVNLLSNAIKFSESNSKVEIIVEELESSAKFSVIDQGRGISAEQSTRLFQRFQQLRPDDPAELAGCGLGLSICKAIIEAHNGIIACEGSAGSGSTFWFALPKPARPRQL
jgi:PAS domain S-box-containing protein